MIDVYNMTGAELKTLWAGTGLTQAQLGAAIGVSPRKMRKEIAAGRVSLIVARAARDYLVSKNRETIVVEARGAIAAFERAYAIAQDL